jgi:hypothetical protein
MQATSIQKAQMTMNKQQQARGKIANTCAQVMITCLSEWVNLAIWEYENTWKALERLNLSEKDLKLFQPLSLSNLKGLSSILKGKCELGEGGRKLPWFWVLQGEEAGSVEGY